MNAASAIAVLERAGIPLVTTGEAAALWRVSPKAAAEMLRRLAVAGIVRRVRRGLWAFGKLDPLHVVARIGEPDPCYVTGLTALRIHGLIEQIPTDIHVATTGRARRITTPFGRFALRHLQPSLFGGFSKVAGAPVADMEKALFDAIYWNAARGKSVRAFPEIAIPRSFDRKQFRRWVERIASSRHRVAVERRARIIGA